MRSRISRAAFVLALALLFGSATAQAATVTQISSTFFIIQLPANVAGWQSTGLTVCPDSKWSIQVQGLANYEDDNLDPVAIAQRWHGPGGQLHALPLNSLATPLVTGAPDFSLVGQIGTTPFYVGDGGALSGSLGSGLLSFGFNDDFVSDNSGVFIIYLTYVSGSCAPVAVTQLPGSGATIGLGPGVPNPTLSGAAFEFESSDSGPYEVSVLDVAGRVVRRIYSGNLAPGAHSVQWDGMNAGGTRVAAGSYFFVVSGAGRQIARKIVMLR